MIVVTLRSLDLYLQITWKQYTEQYLIANDYKPVYSLTYVEGYRLIALLPAQKS